MFNLLFASGHGGATAEIKLLCEQAGVQLSLPGTETRDALNHLVKDEDAKKHNVKLYRTLDEIHEAIHNKEINGWLVARPETLEKIRYHFGDSVPIAARHSINSYRKYQKLGLRNFMSPSRSALKKMNTPNSYLSVKVRNFEAYNEFQLELARKRKGYFSYIHHYKKYWSRAYSFFEEVIKQVDNAVHIENFGKDSEKGIVDDKKTMIASKATLHIKDGQVCCNAPITSICLGIPVLMDYETLSLLGMEDYIIHNVSGLLFETPQECVNAIRTLEIEPEYLDQLSERTRTFARLKCSYSQNDLRSFRTFLYRMQ